MSFIYSHSLPFPPTHPPFTPHSNTLARIRRCCLHHSGSGTDRSPEEFLNVLKFHCRQSEDPSTNPALSLNELSSAFSALGVYEEVPPKECEAVVKRMSRDGKESVAFLRVFSVLNIPLPESLQKVLTAGNRPLPANLNAEIILRILLEQVQRNGLQVVCLYGNEMVKTATYLTVHTPIACVYNVFLTG